MSEKNLGPFEPGRALNLLFNRFGDELTKEELKFLAGASDYAESKAGNMASLFTMLAGLAGHKDAAKEVGIDESIINVFWQTADVFKEIAELIYLANWADFLLKNPGAFKAPDKRDLQ